jgi:hypothetical protein
LSAVLRASTPPPGHFPISGFPATTTFQESHGIVKLCSQVGVLLVVVPSTRLVSVGGDDRIRAKAHAAVFAAVSPRPLERAHGMGFRTRFGGVRGSE